jgi:2-polyprenyl-3-methyl-5-hydroxy-6-metoxy-1,4-benzoquinol methylase
LVIALAGSTISQRDATFARMTTEDARALRGSTDRFGYEWAKYANILPEHEDQLARWMGTTGLASFAGKRVMDVGCGMGRNPFFMLKNGAAHLTAVDVDDGSLASARKNLAGLPADVRKGSAYDLDPKELGTFDRVTCIGVLHHVAEPERALDAMWRCVAPGGDLVLWCYAKEGNRLILPVIQTFRFVGSRLPIEQTHTLAKITSRVTWPLLSRLPFRTDYYRKLRTLSPKNVESIIFDQMLPHIAHYWTRADMERLAAPLGGELFLEFVQGNSWHARITKKR